VKTAKISHDPTEFLRDSLLSEDDMPERLDQIKADGTLTKQSVDEVAMCLTEMSRMIHELNETELPSDSRKVLVSIQGKLTSALLSAKDAQTYLRWGKKE